MPMTATQHARLVMAATAYDRKQAKRKDALLKAIGESKATLEEHRS